MKSILALIVLLFSLSFPAFGLDVTLEWDDPTTRADGTSLLPAEIGEYRVYSTMDDTIPLTFYQSVPSDTTVPSGGRGVLLTLDPGQYIFAVTTIDTDGLESELSNTTVKFVPKANPSPPGRVR